MKIGIDIGGSHIGIGLIDKDENIVEKYETDINGNNKSDNLNEFIENYILQVIKKISKEHEIELIGIASPGTPKDGKLTSLVNLGIDEFDITKIIQKEFNGKIQINNDAKCAGLAEKQYGSLKDYDDAVFMCLGTGIGGAVFLGGKELKPKRNPGFEIGHMIIKKDGILCNCGKKGCFETYCSMKRLKNSLIDVMGLNKDTTAKELLELLKERKEETEIQKILKEYIDNLIIGLSNITDLLEPEAICLGGSFVYFKDILYKMLLEEFNSRRYVFNKNTLPEIKLASLGNDAGIIGSTIM